MTIIFTVDCRKQRTKAVYQNIPPRNNRQWSQENANVFFITSNELPEAAREPRQSANTPNCVHVPKIDSPAKENGDDPPSYGRVVSGQVKQKLQRMSSLAGNPPPTYESVQHELQSEVLYSATKKL